VTAWYQQDIEECLQALDSDAERGLRDQEAQRRLAEHGPNELIERGTKSPWKILWEQLTGVLVLVLIAAAVVSTALGWAEGDFKDPIVIMAIVILNALIGFRQEYRAEKAIAALKRLAVPHVQVRREGHTREISARDIVPGDIVSLDSGDSVPADGRLIESANLRIQEASLTGESEPVEKDASKSIDEERTLGDRDNMAYMGTAVTFGRGEMLVTATGMETELGQIAEMIQTAEAEPTPLQRRLDRLGKLLALIVLGIVALIFVLGLLRSEQHNFERIRVLFLTAVSMAVAAVPEGLPAVVTIALALGAQRMLARHALIRKLPAVETLGSVTAICSDKTGTLTKNEMTVTVLDVAGRRIDVTERIHGEQSDAMLSAEEIEEIGRHPALALLLAGGALCNDAVLEHEDGRPDQYYAVGDPTEGALVVAAARWGMHKERLEEALPRVSEVPFDRDRKRMTTVHRCEANHDEVPSGLHTAIPGGDGGACHLALTKGAVDSLLDVCSKVWIEDHQEEFGDEHREKIVEAHDQLAGDGMRVLGVAFRPEPNVTEEPDAETLEKNLVFVGLVGMMDPPRPEVRAAIEKCRTAGIRPLMVTGDHPLTARSIAGKLGIDTEAGVVPGRELEKYSDEELDKAVGEASVFARVSPRHKLRIVKALQKQGHITAMTGDGVNDAPALKQSDIGVAMGITGTDVSKEAADMVLQDDHFATIVAAVEQGRIVYDNIRKFIKYTMTSNAGEIWVMLAAPFFGMPLPLLPLQILWINLVTDGLPGLALSVEPGERNTMQRDPRPPGESILGRGMGRDILWIGLLMGAVSLGTGFSFWLADPEATGYWRTIVFTVLTLSQMGNALAIRSERDSIFTIGFWSNKMMLGSVLLTFVLQLGLIYIPWAQKIFDTQPLLLRDLGLCLLLSTIVFIAVELQKWWMRRS